MVAADPRLRMFLKFVQRYGDSSGVASGLDHLLPPERSANGLWRQKVRIPISVMLHGADGSSVSGLIFHGALCRTS